MQHAEKRRATLRPPFIDLADLSKHIRKNAKLQTTISC
jgi:hypothetical protein